MFLTGQCDFFWSRALILFPRQSSLCWMSMSKRLCKIGLVPKKSLLYCIWRKTQLQQMPDSYIMLQKIWRRPVFCPLALQIYSSHAAATKQKPKPRATNCHSELSRCPNHLSSRDRRCRATPTPSTTTLQSSPCSFPLSGPSYRAGK